MPWPAEVSEWWAQCVRAGYERQKQIAPEVVAYREIQELIAERDQLRATLAERKASFDLRWNADMRAIKRWQAAHPDQKRTWPDHADLCVWLLEQDDQLRATIARQEQAIEQLRDSACDKIMAMTDEQIAALSRLKGHDPADEVKLGKQAVKIAMQEVEIANLASAVRRQAEELERARKDAGLAKQIARGIIGDKALDQGRLSMLRAVLVRIEALAAAEKEPAK